MPHKHTRKATDAKDFDLPPTKIARPLPVISNKKRAEGAKTEYVASRGGKRKRGRDNDDTPRAFKRLMAFTPGLKLSGLDDGVDKKSKSKSKKQKEPTKPEEEIAVPSIRPGESLSDFAARVDATIPVAGLINKTTRGGKDPLGLKAYRTRKEKKMHKLYDQWRAEEKKIQEQKEEQYEEAAARELEDGWTGADGSKGANDWDVAPKEEGKNKKKKKQKRGRGGAKDKEEDPWEELRRKRGEDKVKFGEVVNAPPSLQKVVAKLPTHE